MKGSNAGQPKAGPGLGARHAEAGNDEYDAFISYRHVEPDRAWALWLHNALETYRVPARLVRERGVQSRVGRVFRDEEELPAAADLSKEIESALKRSRFLIIICSPRTPESRWVNEEINRFRELGRHDRILALLIEGEPRDAFPPSLCEIRRGMHESSNGLLDQSVEPLAADVRASPTDRMRHRKWMAKLRLLAALLGCRFDDLRQREQERLSRRMVHLSTGTAVLLVLIASLAVAAFLESSEARLQRNKALTQADETRRENERAECLRYDAYINLAGEAIRSNNHAQAADWLTQARLIKGPDAFGRRGWEWFYLRRMCRYQLTLSTENYAGTGLDAPKLYFVTFSPDGRFIASSGAHGIRICDATSGRARSNPIKYSGYIAGVAFSPDGARLASGTREKTVGVWDVATGRNILTLKGHVGNVTDVAFSPDGARLASGGGPQDGRVRVWDAVTGQDLLTLEGHEGGVSDVVFSPDGTRLASAGVDARMRTVRVWNAATGRALFTLKSSVGDRVAFSPDGARLAAAGKGHTVQVSDGVTGQTLLTVKGHEDEVSSVAFSPDGARLASGSRDRTVRVWEAATGQALLTLKGHMDNVTDVAFSPDGARLASAGEDGTVRVWDATTGQTRSNGTVEVSDPDVGQVKLWISHGGHLNAVAFSPDGARVAATGEDSTVRVWDVTTGKDLLTIGGRDSRAGAASSVSFGPDGNRLAAVGDHSLRVWDVASGQVLLNVTGHHRGFTVVAFSPDGARLASVNEDLVAQVWDAATGQELRAIHGLPPGVSGVAFSPDGARVAIAGSKEVAVWDTADEGPSWPVFTLRGHDGNVTGVAFSADGRFIASTGSDGVRIHDAASGQALLNLKGHEGNVTGAAFSPDGARLASAGVDGTMRVWDVTTGQTLLILQGQKAAVTRVAFSPDGARLASVSLDGILRIWDGPPVPKERANSLRQGNAATAGERAERSAERR